MRRSSHRQYYKKVRRQKQYGEAIDFEDDFFAEKQALTRVTPARINHLEEGQIFVFGSNAMGHHDGGAARIAPLFARAYSLPNVYLPAEFWKVLSYKYR